MPAANTAPKITPREAARLIDDLSAIVARAAAAILAYPFSEVARRVKADRSPVTAADLASEQVILERLASLLPGLPVVAEESGTGARTALGASLALVDPLDGTKEFLAGRDEYSVNLALVTDGTPIAGVIAAPARGLMWRGVVGAAAERLRLAWNEGPNRASERRAIRTRRPAPAELTVLTSRSHADPRTEALLAGLPVARRERCGSALKFCRLAQGDADLYPRLSPVSEWDIAAGSAILTAAGGRISDPHGLPLQFGRADRRFIVEGFLAWGDPARATAT
ncbi:MAG: 3'(2'),5'-bisphosphate nucleotidase CysQ [Pseudolabrys sp.]|nr:3'(2'),5'-bisphosphate nucleotidase CysQ [Pseudolabrys sp.]